MTKLWRRWPAAFLALAAFLGLARLASAHGFGERYDLPVPLGLYLAGAGAAVALSFAAIGVFVKAEASQGGYPRYNLLRPLRRFERLAAAPWLRLTQPLPDAVVTPIERAVGVLWKLAWLFHRLGLAFLLAFIVAAGLGGSPSPALNIAPTFVWIIWWVGMAYASAFVGNVWTLINPWKAAFEVAEAIIRRLTGARSASLDLPYPAWLGVWPGVALFVIFAWIELVFPESARPSTIARLAITYSAITWTGMVLFGKDRWLHSGETFSLIFGLIARFSPTEVRTTTPQICRACPLDCLDADGRCVDCYRCFREAPASQRELNLRPPAVGLLTHRPASPSLHVLVVVLLATVSFDGIQATPAWATIQSSLFEVFPSFAGHRLTAVDTAGLVGFALIILAVYRLFARLARLAGGRERSADELARYFALSLMPIALGYHLAHFLTFLIDQGQFIIPMLSDPYGRGWDLFGTAGFERAVGIVGARFAWFTAVIAIVIGHVLAVYLAHVTALRVFKVRTHAQRSQYPMLVLMVGYTVLSLWILAQPIVAE